MSFRHGLRATFIAAGVLVLAGAAQAQMHITPGLWEQQITMKSSNAQTDAAMAQMQEKLAAMPPDQRKMVEQMMASHGVGMGAAPNSVRTCITKEQAARDAMPQHDGRCSQQDVSRSGNSMTYKFTCQGQGGGDAAHTVTGTGEFVLNSPTSYTGHSVTDTVIQGKPAHMQADIVGKWLGSDCGSIKPVEVPAK